MELTVCGSNDRLPSPAPSRLFAFGMCNSINKENLYVNIFKRILQIQKNIFYLCHVFWYKSIQNSQLKSNRLTKNDLNENHSEYYRNLIRRGIAYIFELSASAATVRYTTTEDLTDLRLERVFHRKK